MFVFESFVFVLFPCVRGLINVCAYLIKVVHFENKPHHMHIMSSTLLTVLHCDIKGPLDVSYNKCKYALIVVVIKPKY